MKKILVAPANFGLGHATRALPVIKELISRGHHVDIATSGAALLLLKNEFSHMHYPEINYYELPDYPRGLQSAGNISMMNLIKEVSKITDAFQEENVLLKDIDRQHNYDLIISDGRYGAYVGGKPSLLIMHQLQFKSKSFLKMFDPLTERFNNYYFSNFDRIIIPDNKSDNISLSGEISKVSIRSLNRKLYYSGILCSIGPLDMPKDIDILVSISGPEPYRSNLEGIVMEQIRDVEGNNKIVLLGKPGNEEHYMLDNNTRILSHAGRDRMTELLNRSKKIISRSGYTTIMEIANIGRMNGLLIPTPGCLEQEYLAERYMDKGWFFSQTQDKVDLAKNITESDKYSGFPKMPKSADNVKMLYEKVLAKYL